ncbi:hypothetical protein KUTeg_006773 [Tegillarca granosa]|uniref:Nuclease HARBI1 n=1 Tax=Tegillarca granosa TaxID=220873 RepID=A0ABQ9FG16_TEGGR|nr:hypothetical protein KUTeg_006773 [Tegillarca granosa]
MAAYGYGYTQQECKDVATDFAIFLGKRSHRMNFDLLDGASPGATGTVNESAIVLRLLKGLEDIKRNRNVRRFFVDRQNPLECLGDEEIFVRYRFRSRTILYITDLESDRLMHPRRRSLPLTPLLQVLVFLRFLASGAFHLLIGDSVDISKATAGRCIRRVEEAIKFLGASLSFFQLEMASCSERFPNVIGCIDGTQVRITKQKFHEKDFANRKGFHSPNKDVVRIDPLEDTIANDPIYHVDNETVLFIVNLLTPYVQHPS